MSADNCIVKSQEFLHVIAYNFYFSFCNARLVVNIHFVTEVATPRSNYLSFVLRFLSLVIHCDSYIPLLELRAHLRRLAARIVEQASLYLHICSRSEHNLVLMDITVLVLLHLDSYLSEFHTIFVYSLRTFPERPCQPLRVSSSHFGPSVIMLYYCYV